MLRISLLCISALPLAGLAAQTPSPDTVAITEWQVPWARTRPRDPFMAPDGIVWFVGQQGHYVGRLDPVSGTITKIDLDPGTGPHNVIVGRSGDLWYSGNASSHIGRVDVRTGRITKYPMPDSTIRDPHTLVQDADGTIWFTVQGGNAVGRLTPATGAVEVHKLDVARARPYGIVLDRQGRPWFTEFGTNRLALINRKDFTLTEYTLPEGARPRRIAATEDGMLWYVDYARGYLGRLDPTSGAVTEWPAPSGRRSLPYGMTSDDAGRLWFVETGVQPNRMVGFDPATESFFSQTDIPGGGGTVRHMMFHAPSRTIWYGADNGQIGRVVVPPPGNRPRPIP